MDLSPRTRPQAALLQGRPRAPCPPGTSLCRRLGTSLRALPAERPVSRTRRGHEKQPARGPG